jgi:hypothetical protein
MIVKCVILNIVAPGIYPSYYESDIKLFKTKDFDFKIISCHGNSKYIYN